MGTDWKQQRRPCFQIPGKRCHQAHSLALRWIRTETRDRRRLSRCQDPPAQKNGKTHVSDRVFLTSDAHLGLSVAARIFTRAPEYRLRPIRSGGAMGPRSCDTPAHWPLGRSVRSVARGPAVGSLEIRYWRRQCPNTVVNRDMSQGLSRGDSSSYSTQRHRLPTLADWMALSAPTPRTSSSDNHSSDV
jgi:hypothetical protein